MTALAALVVVVALTLAGTSSGGSGPAAQGPAYTPITDTGGEQAAVHAVVAELSTYVEHARGLNFLHPVEATVLASDQFDSRLKAMGSGRLDATYVGNVATRKALGLLPADYDPAKQPVDTTGILGIYDPATKQVLVRGGDISIYTRKTLVHELTHALQDQHFDLSHLLAAGDNDAALAQRSLVEGDARRIENNWVSTLSIDEQNLLERQARKAGDEAFPPGYLLSIESFPYIVGERFTTSLTGLGSQVELDKAFAHPPASTKQIIDPQRYVAGDNPVSVPAPRADGLVVDQGTLGEFELIYVLAQAISPGAAVPLASDWAGSSYVTWQGPSGPCTRANVATESSAGAQAMLAALQLWASVVPSRSVTSGSVLTLTSCA